MGLDVGPVEVGYADKRLLISYNGLEVIALNLVGILKMVAEQTDNKVDDALIALVEKALD